MKSEIKDSEEIEDMVSRYGQAGPNEIDPVRITSELAEISFRTTPRQTSTSSVEQFDHDHLDSLGRSWLVNAR